MMRKEETNLQADQVVAATQVPATDTNGALPDALHSNGATAVRGSQPRKATSGTLPNFLIIGAQKCGTTALHRQLKQHPQIYMSPVKETHFFVREGTQSNDPQMISTIEAYCALFAGVKDEIAIGEASPSYLSWPGVPERIQHYIPDAKLIAVLRHPAERAHSAFLHEIAMGREPLTDFAKALEEERVQDAEERRRNNLPVRRYIYAGFYYAHLKRYFERFDRSQIKVYLYEDFTSDPVGMIQDIFRFLGVDDNFVPDQSRYVKGGVPKIKALHTLQRKPNLIKAVLKPLIPTRMRQRMSENLNNMNRVKIPLDSAVRQQLIETYQEDILNLQDLIQRDLSRWLA